MSFPIKKICHTGIVFTDDPKRVPNETFVIKESKHIDIHQKLVFVKLYIIRTDLLRKSVEAVSIKHFSSVLYGSF